MNSTLPHSSLVLMSDAELVRAPHKAFGPHCAATGLKSKVLTRRKAKFAIRARDAYGRDINHGGDTFRVTVRGPQALNVTLKDMGDGTYEGRYVADTSGEYEFNVMTGGVHVKGSPFVVKVKKAKTLPAACEMSGSGLEQAVVGDASEILLLTKDELGFTRDVGGDKVESGSLDPTQFSLFLDEKKELDGKVQDHEDGRYTLVYEPHKPGRYTGHVKIRNIHVHGSPFEVTVEPVKVGSNQVVAHGPNLCHAVAGVESRFLVFGRDQFNNRCPIDPDSLDVTIKGAHGTLAGRVLTDADGACRVTFIITQPGQYDIHVHYEGKHIFGSPFRRLKVVPSIIHPQSCIISGDGLVTAVAGQKASFHIIAADEHRNRHEAGGEKIRASLDGPEPLTPTVVDKNDGSYLVRYECTKAGLYKLSLVVRGEHLRGSPYDVEVLPGPLSHRMIECEGSGVMSFVAGTTAEVVIVTKDGLGNVLKEGGETFTASIRGHAEIGIPLVDCEDGTYRATYSADEAGRYVLDIKRGNIPVSGSPFKVVVECGQTDPSASTASGDAFSQADAGEKVFFEVEARDAHGNRRSEGGEEVISRINGPSEVETSVVDEGGGGYRVSYCATVAGDYTITAMICGSHVKGSPGRLVVMPGPSRGENCRVNGAQSVWTAGIEARYVVMGLDQFGNRQFRGGESVTVAQNYGPKRLDWSLEDMGDGTYNVSFVPTLGGQYSMSIMMEGEHVHGSPFTFNVDAGEPDPTACEASGQGLFGFLASIPSKIVIQAKDAFHNRLTKGGAKFKVFLVDSTGSMVANKVIDNNDGTYVAELKTSCEGEYSVEILLWDRPIRNSPFQCHVSPVIAGETQATFDLELVAGSRGAKKELMAPSEGDIQVSTVFVPPAYPDGVDPSSATTMENVPNLPTLPHTISRVGGNRFQIICEPKRAGTYTVDVKARAQHVVGSPFRLVVDPGPVDTRHCVVMGPGLTSCRAGRPTTFSVVACDAFGNRVMKGDEDDYGFHVALVDGPRAIKTKVVGYNRISVTREGRELTGGPWMVLCRAGPTHAPSCTVSSDQDLCQAAVGNTQFFTIHANDQYGNPRDRGGDAFRVHIGGPGSVPCALIDQGDGTYLATFEYVLSGEYRVHVTLGKTHISESPWTVNVSPADVEVTESRGHRPDSTKGRPYTPRLSTAVLPGSPRTSTRIKSGSSHTRVERPTSPTLATPGRGVARTPKKG